MAWLMAVLDGLVGLVARLGVPADLCGLGLWVVLGLLGYRDGLFAAWGGGDLCGGGIGVCGGGVGELGVEPVVDVSGRVHEAMHVQWLRFVGVNSVGFIFNRGVFFALVALYVTVRHQPVLGIMAGSAAGLTFNYFLSKTFVFR